MQEGSEEGMELAKEALRLFEEDFICSKNVDLEAKKTVLLTQKNIFRLLSKALDYPGVGELVAHVLCRVILELHEPPADYPVSRLESAEGRGMPNFILFSLLRALRPKNSPLASQIVVFLLGNTAELIRPYFSRVSLHLTEATDTSVRTAPSTARLATLNVMTRILQLPIPYHLVSMQAQLQPASDKVDMFYTLGIKEIADEICPVWVAEFVHKMINTSTNLLQLTFAMQVTQAALKRAQKVLSIVMEIQRRKRSASANREAGDSASPLSGVRLQADEMRILAPSNGLEEDWDAFNADLSGELLTRIPRREEFWHRLTQQILPQMEQLFHATDNRQGLKKKIEFVYERFLLLTEMYNEVFRTRTPWTGVAPSVLPQLREGTITAVLRDGNDILFHMPPIVISSLCSLLVSNLSKGVPITKIHHINVSKGPIKEWPLLLSILLWGVRRREDFPAWCGDQYKGKQLPATPACSADSFATMEALLWITRLVQCVMQSVTISFNAEWAEALLWVMNLRYETIPCFLHLVNNLQMRSLSKGADRLAQELMELESTKGVLVISAAPFIGKVEEKLKGAADAPVEVKKHVNKKQNNQASQLDFWTDDQRSNIALFKSVVEQVDKQWPNRERVADHLLAYYRTCRDVHPDTREIHGANLTAQATFGEVSSMVPPHKQMELFCETLQSPVLPVTDEETVAYEKLTKLSLSGDDQAFVKFVKSFSGPALVRMESFSYEVSGRILRELNQILKLREDGKTGTAVEKNLVKVCDKLVKHLVSGAEDIFALYRANRSILPISFLLVLLTSLRVLLSLGTPGQYEPGTFDALAEFLMSVYCGSLSVQGRMVYACLLSLHYLEHGRDTTTGGQDEEGDGKKEGSEGVVFAGARVPAPIVKNRFLIQRYAVPDGQVPEADILSFLQERWTERDMYHISLRCPARLHNTLLCFGKKAEWDLLRSVFPEVTVEGDMEVINFSNNASSALVDPRYFLPLVQTAVSLPQEARRLSWANMCLPLLIRALSFTDEASRAYAASVLSTAYVKKGAGLVVSSFARLKLWQLSSKQSAKKHGSGHAHIPRLPAPLSSFLVHAIRPLGRYENVLHNHIVRFLHETNSAFAEAVPFSKWLFSFPLGCVSVPLMKEKEHQRARGAPSDNAKSAAGDLHTPVPPHLDFIRTVIEHSCETNGDAAALMHTSSVKGLMLLCDLLTSSPEIRLKCVQTLQTICAASYNVTYQLAIEGGILLWVVTFAQQLCLEYGPQPHLYTDPLFVEVLVLLRTLCRTLVCGTDLRSTQHRLAPHAFVLQVHEHVGFLRERLAYTGVTAQQPLSLVESILSSLHEHIEQKEHMKQQRRENRMEKRPRANSPDVARDSVDKKKK
ncbi:hypothetical protein AGDE_13481 [Angomonas deanei]|uniref:Nucleolar pre-ribosomal-associated protein 1, putative n=1 Tax=Angomonas deanei TaxID=59799 RepID=A0A7G2CKJ0_9TRYP|nr:hypothetical protein AGDE_13481 [Angomonas deanei]CAD2219929.1 Nucleolar pre-ribosomal-associated protein 1, putative [Angomonas deanei]|eukprot:EPY22304.1 hypothetical protein AGDE_13481 [Angomonas deanei]